MTPNTTEDREQQCKYCSDTKVAHRFLSDDAGATIEAEYKDGKGSDSHAFTLSHAWDDSWWACPKGDEVRVVVLTPDSYDSLVSTNTRLREASRPFAQCEMSGSLDPTDCRARQKAAWANTNRADYLCNGCVLREALAGSTEGKGE